MLVGTGKRVRIYVGEHDHTPGGKQPVWEAILHYLRREGAAGATMFRGLAGFGAHSRLHTARFADVVPDLPVVIEWIDGPERIERLLPHVCEMAASGTITVEDVGIAKYTHRAPHALPPDSVGQVMTRQVVTVQPDTPIREIERLLIERDVRALPVVDADNRLIGILTSRDLVERGEVAGTAGTQKTAADVMTRDVASTAAEAGLHTAVHLMVERRLKRLPVVDAAGRLVGMLSRLDVLRTMGEDYHPPVPEQAPPSAPAQTVREVMRTQVPTVAANAPLGEVLDAVTSTRLSRAIVLDEQHRVLGVVSDADLLARLDPSGSALGQRRGDLVARDLIRIPPVVAAAETPLGEAVRRILESGRRVLPITDGDGHFLGAVDRADLLAQLRRGRE